MKKNGNITNYTANELKIKRSDSRTNWDKADSISDNDLHKIIAADEDKSDFMPNWTKAELVLPKSTP